MPLPPSAMRHDSLLSFLVCCEGYTVSLIAQGAGFIEPPVADGILHSSLLAGRTCYLTGQSLSEVPLCCSMQAAKKACDIEARDATAAVEALRAATRRGV